MPDPTFQTVSASQASALFDRSPYMTRFALWQAFQKKDQSILERPETARMRLGKLYQPLICTRVALDHQLEVTPNENDEYVRNGQLGCTRDAHMWAADLGRVIVEVKRVHWLRWRQTWTDELAPPDIEIQLQVQLLVEGCDNGIIVCDNGDEDLLYYRRVANKEIHQRLLEEAAIFFESLAKNEPPDPYGGDTAELKILDDLYPEVIPAKVIEDYEDQDLALLLRMYRHNKIEQKSAERECERLKPKILARAEDAQFIKANGFTAKIRKTPVSAQICTPHAEPKQLRKGFIQTVVEVEEVPLHHEWPDPFSTTEGPEIAP